MQIGLFALKGYFAAKGTGDVGAELSLVTVKSWRNKVVCRDVIIFRFLVNLKFPTVTGGGRIGCNASDGQANLPERCYSYLLQEWMNLLASVDVWRVPWSLGGYWMLI